MKIVPRLLLLCVLSGIVFWFLKTPSAQPWILSYCEFLAQWIGTLLSWIDPAIRVEDAVLVRTTYAHALEIVPSCSALESIIIISVLVLVTPVAWHRRLQGLVLTIAAIYLINAIRIVLLVYGLVLLPKEVFELFHEQWLVFLMALAASTVGVAWLYWALGNSPLKPLVNTLSSKMLIVIVPALALWYGVVLYIAPPLLSLVIESFTELALIVPEDLTPGALHLYLESSFFASPESWTNNTQISSPENIEFINADLSSILLLSLTLPVFWCLAITIAGASHLKRLLLGSCVLLFASAVPLLATVHYALQHIATQENVYQINNLGMVQVRQEPTYTAIALAKVMRDLSYWSVYLGGPLIVLWLFFRREVLTTGAALFMNKQLSEPCDNEEKEPRLSN